LGGWRSFTFGDGVQILQQIVTGQYAACGPYFIRFPVRELGQDHVAITRTRLKRLPVSEDDVSLPELKVETACAYQRLRPACLDAQASDGRTLPTSLDVEGRDHILNPLAVDYLRRNFE
jgi:hypothetical protein